MKEITINTVQGIGDIFWVYQKVAPYVDRINWRIWRVGDDSIQFRSQEFLHLLPKTANYSFPVVPVPQYHDLAAKTFPLDTVLKHPIVNYAVNRALEDGSDLYEMDPGYTVQRFVPMQIGKGDIEPRQPSLCLFVSGSRLEYVWSVETWALHTKTLLDVLGLKHVMVIGAEWDNWAATDVTILLQRMGISVTNLCKQMSLATTIQLMRACKFFFGYQSGLSVIAENYNIPQLMVYFPFLRKMMYTWAKPESRQRIYNAITFDEPHITDIIRHIPERIT
jgi:ADP-heptose:LPS heptosyltransferase